ncbi:MAG TPA: hypothetical protein VHW23_10540 [Kofleriaceae bacterium]|nr:hypothetical protein [Kofleriaceae bacterium]
MTDGEGAGRDRRRRGGCGRIEMDANVADVGTDVALELAAQPVGQRLAVTAPCRAAAPRPAARKIQLRRATVTPVGRR